MVLFSMMIHWTRVFSLNRQAKDKIGLKNIKIDLLMVSLDLDSNPF